MERDQRFRKPEVYNIGSTKVNEGQLAAYLKSIGAEDWTTDAVSDPEKLMEVYGRLCYRSFGVGLNKNVTRVREGNIPYLNNITKVNHGAVLEHCVENFVFTNVSRVFTHELVRHRVGVAISQESMRYVRLNEIHHYESMLMDETTKDFFIQHAEYTEDLIRKLENHLQIDAKADFADKKLLTSLIRRIAPDGILTSIGWSANIRTLRHVIPLRTSIHAEEEIRYVFDDVAKRMCCRFPAAFGDFYRNVNGEWLSKHWG